MRVTAVGMGAVLALALTVAACSSKDSTTQPPQQAAVTISGFKFLPDTVTVPRGSTVTWTNNDTAPHTATVDSGTEFASPHIAQNGTFSHQFTTAGTFSYHCAVHASMAHAVIIVQ
jgi:plastocyanin